MRKHGLVSVLLLSICITCFAATKVNSQHPASRLRHPSLETNVKKPIIVSKTNPTFTIRLKSNPTTGFMWLLKKYNSNIMAPVEKRYVPTPTKKVGAGGIVELTFRLKARAFVIPHISKVKLLYARPWELDSKQNKQLTFKVITYDH